MQQTKDRPAASAAAQSDIYGTLLVHAEPGESSSRRVEAAARFARAIDARLIGLGAETFEPLAATDAFSGFTSGEWVSLVQEQVERNLKAAEAAFRRDSAGAEVEWRGVQDYPHRALARLARGADLIVSGPKRSAPSTSVADPADVVLTAARPVLLVPETRTHLRADSVVVAWKDTRECRRAVADALPLLRRASDVVVLAVCRKGAEDQAASEVDDVVANLKRRRVAARPEVKSGTDESVTAEIEAAASRSMSDLIVTGAYGHSRMREWVFGGVTADLLHQPPCFVLMSH